VGTESRQGDYSVSCFLAKRYTNRQTAVYLFDLQVYAKYFYKKKQHVAVMLQRFESPWF
jgi:hypothetical protein